MNKNEERTAFDSVFGRFGLSVTETEEPDFICSAASAEEFGVEVTEFFLTETDARMEKIRGYVADLIAGGRYRHKDDKNEIKVKEVIYTRAETGERIQLKAIPRPIPSYLDTSSKLLNLIAEKNRKCSRYQKRIRLVDLIVHDVDHLLRFETVRQLLEPMIFAPDSAIVQNSPFREIYVITKNVDKGVVCVPLRANLFVGEILFFSSIYQDYLTERSSRSTVGVFLSTLAKHLITHFPAVEILTEDDASHFVFGSHSWTYTERQESQITERSVADRSTWKPLSQVVDTAPLPERLREMIEAKRPEFFGCCELYFPVDSAADSSTNP